MPALNARLCFSRPCRKVWFRHSYFLSLPFNVSRRGLLRDLKFCNPLLSRLLGVDNIDSSARFDLYPRSA
jgi:hypothetical protein